VVIQTTISDAPSIVLLCLYRLSSDLRRFSVLSGPSTEAVMFSSMTYIYTTVEPGSALCVPWNPASS